MPLFLENPHWLKPFQNGDRALLERVYWAYLDHVEAIVRHGLHSVRGNFHIAGPGKSELEDLVQETFTRAFVERTRRTYDGKRPYGPFLAAIARNLIVDHARRRNRELIVDELPTPPPELADDEPWTDAETVRAVEAYLAQLGPELRNLHQRRYVLNETQEDAARALGISRQQLRTQERRLRDGLAEHLANQERLQPVETVKKITHG